MIDIEVYESDTVIQAELDSTAIIETELESIVVIQGNGAELPDYKGKYEITPGIEKQVLQTKNRSMRDNVTIKEIPTYAVSNSEGTTFIIGGIESVGQ